MLNVWSARSIMVEYAWELNFSSSCAFRRHFISASFSIKSSSLVFSCPRQEYNSAAKVTSLFHSWFCPSRKTTTNNCLCDTSWWFYLQKHRFQVIHGQLKYVHHLWMCNLLTQLIVSHTILWSYYTRILFLSCASLSLLFCLLKWHFVLLKVTSNAALALRVLFFVL